jgi:hypothetical protein
MVVQVADFWRNRVKESFFSLLEMLFSGLFWSFGLSTASSPPPVTPFDVVKTRLQAQNQPQVIGEL